MKNSLHGFAHMTPPGMFEAFLLFLIPKRCFSKNVPLIPLPSYSKFLLDSEVKGCTMRVNHAPIIGSSLTAASPLPPVFVPHRHLSAAYLFISLTVCADRIKKSGNVALQQPWSKEISLGCRTRPPCPALPCHFSHIKSSSLLFHFTLAHACGRWESGGKAWGKPWVSLSD